MAPVVMNKTTGTTMSPTAAEALRTIRNLWKPTLQTGTKTTRAQNEIFQSLCGNDLAVVGNALDDQ